MFKRLCLISSCISLFSLIKSGLPLNMLALPPPNMLSISSSPKSYIPLTWYDYPLLDRSNDTKFSFIDLALQKSATENINLNSCISKNFSVVISPRVFTEVFKLKRKQRKFVHVLLEFSHLLDCHHIFIEKLWVISRVKYIGF